MVLAVVRPGMVRGTERAIRYREPGDRGMYYLKARSELDGGARVDDYFEAAADGVLMRLVSHADGRWWHSDGYHGDELELADLDEDSFIPAEEFEHAWHLARVSGGVHSGAPMSAADGLTA
jgi:hypothetical protein